jgi:hypothetical protein
MPRVHTQGPLPVPRNRRAEKAEKRVRELEAAVQRVRRALVGFQNSRQLPAEMSWSALVPLNQVMDFGPLPPESDR